MAETTAEAGILSIPAVAAAPPIPRQPRAPGDLAAEATWRVALLTLLTDLHASNRTVATALVDLLAVCGAGVVFAGQPVPVAAAYAAVVVAAGYFGTLYGDRDTVQTRGVLWYPGLAILPVLLVSFGGAVTRLLSPSAAAALVPAAWLMLSAVRLLTWTLLAICRRTGHGTMRAVVVGSGRRVSTVVRKMSDFPEGGLTPVAVVPLQMLSVAGSLERVVVQQRAQHVVLVPTHTDDIDLIADLQRNRGLDARFSLVPPLGDLFLHPGRVSELGGVPFIPLGRLLRTRTRFPGKRLFDVAFAGLLLVALSPVLMLSAAAIKLADGGPVLFRQRRVGKAGQTFAMLKFRSMVVGADALRPDLAQHNVSDGLLFRMAQDPRVTGVGRILRRLSVDELPQLWNVIRGEMSLVGPRPLPVDPDAFSPGESERHTVLPGITGYWQISGGNGLSYQEMVTLDLAYIRNWSLWLDVRLMLRTLPALIHRHDPC